MANEKLDKFKTSITKGVTVINMKTTSLFETAKFKTHISTLNNDIKRLKYDLGESIYNSWAVSNIDIVDFEQLCHVIKQKEDEIVQLQQEIVDIEQQSKKVLGEKEVPEHKQMEIATFICQKCGTQYQTRINFCRKCGAQMG